MGMEECFMGMLKCCCCAVIIAVMSCDISIFVLLFCFCYFYVGQPDENTNPRDFSRTSRTIAYVELVLNLRDCPLPPQAKNNK
jgi:hypothetical protein